MSNSGSSEANIDFGSGNTFTEAMIRFENIAGRDMIINHDPHDVTLLRDLNPYLGLQSFTYADHAKYAGRESRITAAVAQLTAPGAEQSFMLITGTSGSGKSSFVQAGVLPALTTHYRKQRMLLAVDVFRPGLHPMASFTAALTRLGVDIPLGHVVTDETWRTKLKEMLPARSLPCLVIDQLEEIFSPHVAAEERHTFINLITGLPRFVEFPIHMLATVRSDFLPDLFDTPLVAFLGQGINLQAMDAPALQQAIERPVTHLIGEVERRQPVLAQRLGPKQWDQAVLARLSQDAAQDAAYLPLLQVTLQDIWQKGYLTLHAYTNLTTAIQERAESVWQFNDYDGNAQLRSEDEQRTIMAILLDLVDVSLDNDARRDVRQSTTITELTANQPNRYDLIQDLVKARLLSISSRQTPEGYIEYVDIIHESLLRNWDRLATAIQKERTTLQRRARFRDDLAQWQTSHQLLEGVRLAAAIELMENNDTATQSTLARTFIEQSIRLRDTQRRHQLRRTQIFASMISILFVLAFGAMIFAINQSKHAEHETQVTQGRLLVEQGLRQSSNKPLLGLRLALEGLAVIPVDAIEAREEARLTLMAMAETGRIAQVTTNTSNIYTSPKKHVFVVERNGMQGELRRISDGSLIATLSGVIRRDERRGHRYIAFSPQEDFFVVDYEDIPSELRRTEDGDVITILPSKSLFWGVIFNPNQKTFFISYEDSPSELRRSDNGDLLASFSNPTSLNTDSLSNNIDIFLYPDPVFSSDGSVFIINISDTSSKLIDGTTGKVISTLNTPYGYNDRLLDLDGNYFLVRPSASSVQIINIITKEIWIYETIERVMNPFLDDEGLMIIKDKDDSFKLKNFITGHIISNLGKNNISSAQISPNKEYIIIQYTDSNPQLIRIKDNQIILNFPNEIYYDTGPFSSDSSRIIVSYSGGKSTIFRTDTGEIITNLTDSIDQNGLYFFPNKNHFVVDYNNSPSEIRRLDSGEIIARLNGRINRFDVAFNKTGDFFIANYTNSNSELWQVNYETKVITLSGNVDLNSGSILFDEKDLFLLIRYDNSSTELWALKPSPILIQVADITDVFSDYSSNTLVVRYDEGSIYILDLDWLLLMNEEVLSFSDYELERILCERLLESRYWTQEDQAALMEQLNGKTSQTCR